MAVLLRTVYSIRAVCWFMRTLVPCPHCDAPAACGPVQGGQCVLHQPWGSQQAANTPASQPATGQPACSPSSPPQAAAIQLPSSGHPVCPAHLRLVQAVHHLVEPPSDLGPLDQLVVVEANLCGHTPGGWEPGGRRQAAGSMCVTAARRALIMAANSEGSSSTDATCLCHAVEQL